MENYKKTNISDLPLKKHESGECALLDYFNFDEKNITIVITDSANLKKEIRLGNFFSKIKDTKYSLEQFQKDAQDNQQNLMMIKLRVLIEKDLSFERDKYKNIKISAFAYHQKMEKLSIISVLLPQTVLELMNRNFLDANTIYSKLKDTTSNPKFKINLTDEPDNENNTKDKRLHICFYNESSKNNSLKNLFDKLKDTRGEISTDKECTEKEREEKIHAIDQFIALTEENICKNYEKIDQVLSSSDDEETIDLGHKDPKTPILKIWTQANNFGAGNSSVARNNERNQEAIDQKNFFLERLNNHNLNQLKYT